MKKKEFAIWFDGFIAGMGDILTPEQSHVLIAKVREALLPYNPMKSMQEYIQQNQRESDAQADINLVAPADAGWQ